MSLHRKRYDGDPIIDTVEDSDQEEVVVPSTPGQEHIDLATEEQDSASILGNAFNGDSIIANQSKWAVIYGTN